MRALRRQATAVRPGREMCHGMPCPAGRRAVCGPAGPFNLAQGMPRPSAPGVRASVADADADGQLFIRTDAKVYCIGRRR